MTDFCTRIEEWMSESEVIQEGLHYEGKRLVASLCRLNGNGGLSLRGLSRKSGLSPTYLSNVLNGKATISPGAFLGLSKLEAETP